MATYYTPSNYALKYYKSFTDERGISVKLNILQRNYQGWTYEIGTLQSLALQIQGDDEVTSPIVKTNLQFSVVDDAYAPTVDATGTTYKDRHYWRYAKWTEFYTPDSTLYLVELYYNNTCIWRGYITPDSYTETLDSYGSVMITVRDNIGHMQDFDFDMGGNSDGLVKVTDLITQAFTKIEFPMELIIVGFEADADYAYLVSEDGKYNFKDLCFNAAALESKTYFDALEEVLNSLGLCLRYCDNATFYLMPLHAMPRCGTSEDATDEQPVRLLQFYGRGSGTRTFDPAYRQITENVNFEQEDEFSPDLLCVKKGKVNTVSTCNFVSYYHIKKPVDPSGKQHPTIKTFKQSTGKYIASSSLPSDLQGWSTLPLNNSLDDGSYAIDDYTSETEGQSMHNYLFLVSSPGTVIENYDEESGITDVTPNFTDKILVFRRKVRTSQLSITLKFAPHPAGFDDSGKLKVLYTHNLSYVVYRVYYSAKNYSTVRYWDGSRWQDTAPTSDLLYNNTDEQTGVDSFTIDLNECEDVGPNGLLTIEIVCIANAAVSCEWTSGPGGYNVSLPVYNGVYARLESITFSASKIKKKLKSDTVTTICNTAYNVRCERNPLLGFLSVDVNFVDPMNYKKAFFVIDSAKNVQFAPYRWRWNNEQSVLPFPVRIHQQLLMFHYTTEELIEGDCGLPKGTSGFGYMAFDAKFTYKGKVYLLKSGTFDFIRGRFTTAQFRSFKYYTDLWDGTETYNNEQLT